MGVVSLSNFRAEVTMGLNRDPGTIPVNRWVNFAYLSVASAVDVEVLYKRWTLSTSVGVFEYNNTPLVTAPLNYAATRSVWDTVDKKPLQWVPINDLLSYEFGTNGIADRWSLNGTKVVIQPPAAVSRSLEVVYRALPDIMTADADVTEIAPHWDFAIAMLATAHAFAIENEEERAVIWFQKAQNYIQTRITEQRAEESLGGLGRSIPQFAEAQ